jgi:hypothetical protein
MENETKPEDQNELGAGSGGGDVKDIPQYSDGLVSTVAGQLEFVAHPPLPPQEQKPPIISMLAADLTGMQGKVDVRGAKGVRLTSGPLAIPMLSPPTTSDSTDGIELVASEAQNVTIQRGLLPSIDQVISMTPGNITIDGGIGTIMIQSMTEITLSVAGGATMIRLTPAGIQIQSAGIQVEGAIVTIQGMLVAIN